MEIEWVQEEGNLLSAEHRIAETIRSPPSDFANPNIQYHEIVTLYFGHRRHMWDS